MRSVIFNRLLLSVALLVVLVALGLWARLAWQVYGPGGWRDTVYELGGLKGNRRATDDYHKGHMRLYRLGGEQSRAQFTGETNGVFEIWTPQYYPSLGGAHRYSIEQFIMFYNRRMEYMYAHPDKFPRMILPVQQGGAANRGQPVSPETNQQPPTAGSSR